MLNPSAEEDPSRIASYLEQYRFQCTPRREHTLAVQCLRYLILHLLCVNSRPSWTAASNMRGAHRLELQQPNGESLITMEPVEMFVNNERG